jgi:hypothetical protein
MEALGCRDAVDNRLGGGGAFCRQTLFHEGGEEETDGALSSSLGMVAESARSHQPHATPCPYGGDRPWFHCPRRMAVLFLRSVIFMCRHCGRAAYASQSVDEIGRAKQ